MKDIHYYKPYIHLLKNCDIIIQHNVEGAMIAYSFKGPTINLSSILKTMIRITHSLFMIYQQTIALLISGLFSMANYSTGCRPLRCI